MNITTYKLFKQLFTDTLLLNIEGEEIQDQAILEIEFIDDELIAVELILH